MAPNGYERCLRREWTLRFVNEINCYSEMKIACVIVFPIFQVLENADVYDTYHKICDDPNLNFKEGPCWRAKLLPYSESQASFIKETKSSDDEASKFPYISHIVVLFSHAITDGYSCVRIMRTVLGLVNAVMAGETIDCLLYTSDAADE